MRPTDPAPAETAPQAEITHGGPALGIFSPDQINAAAAAAAEKANGGKFFDRRFYNDEQRAFWRGVALASLNAAIRAWNAAHETPEKTPERGADRG